MHPESASRRHLNPSLITLLCLPAIASLCGCQSGSVAVTGWLVGDTREIRPDSAPLLESEMYSAARGRIELAAAVRETIAFQLALRSPTPPAGPFDVSVSDLTGAGGTIAASACVRLYRAHAVRAESLRAWHTRFAGRTSPPPQLYDVLAPWDAPRAGGPIRLPDGDTRVVWIDLHVPLSAEPGEYRGTLTVSPPSASAPPVFQAEIVLTVLPVALPADRALPILCLVDPRDWLGASLRTPGAVPEELRILPDEASHDSTRRRVDLAMRLLHDHRATPALWGSFPKYRLVEERTAEIEWGPYDALVGAWFDGTAFDDRVAPPVIVAPVSAQHPDADRNGGFGSPSYARVLAAYLAACREHFEQRGWLSRAVIRPLPPAPLSAELLSRVRRLAGIAAQSETGFPVAAHVPLGSMRPLGWSGAPADEPPRVDIAIVAARWADAELLARRAALGGSAWFMPDRPPYSGSLSLASDVVDARCLAWMAFRYGWQGVWIERSSGGAGEDEPLLYDGGAFGSGDEPLASARLKRLRRGAQDYELLRLAAQNGMPLLAQRTSSQLVRWAFSDACAENLLRTRDCGWSRDPAAYELARKVLLYELAGRIGGGPPSDEPGRMLADWGRLMASAAPARAEAVGSRLRYGDGGVTAQAFVAVNNDTDEAITGTWTLPAPPVGWQLTESPGVTVAPQSRSSVALEFAVQTLEYNADGVYTFPLRFESATVGSLDVEGRLAVAACPRVDSPPRIDGRIDDWVIGLNNVAADFRLARGDGAPVGSFRPQCATRAFFCSDADHVYVAIRCEHPPAERPLARSDNVIPLDEDGPWEQDVIELLLCPRGATESQAEDIFVLSVKPNGVTRAVRGPLTDPPMNVTRLWAPAAQVAVGRERDAWVVELALPIASLDAVGSGASAWGVNVTRLDARRGEYSSWSGARGYTYAPELLGNLLFGSP